MVHLEEKERIVELSDCLEMLDESSDGIIDPNSSENRIAGVSTCSVHDCLPIRSTIATICHAINHRFRIEPSFGSVQTRG